MLQAQVMALAQRLSSVTSNLRKLLVEITDMTHNCIHTLVVATKAMERLKLPASNVVAFVDEPCNGEFVTLVLGIAEGLGCTIYKSSSKTIVKSLLENTRDIAEPKGIPQEVIEMENLHASFYSRHAMLLMLSHGCQAVFLGNADMTEWLCGWVSFGVDVSHYSINSGVPKTLMEALLHWEHRVLYAKSPSIQTKIKKTLDYPIGMSCRRPGDTMHNVSERHGPHELYDYYAYFFLRQHFKPMKILRLAYQAFHRDYTMAQLKHWFILFLERVFKSQFKRNTMGDSVKVAHTSASVRGEWRVPTDFNPSLFLLEAKQVPTEGFPAIAEPAKEESVKERLWYEV